MTCPDLIVESGAVTALRLFDVAYSIDLKAVEDLWTMRQKGSVARSTLSSAPPKSLTFDVPPVLITLPPLDVEIEAATHQATVSARIYDFGVISISVRIATKPMSWDNFTAFANSIDRTIGAKVQNGPWKGILSTIMSELDPAMTRPNNSPLQEDYLIATVQKWNEPIKGIELPERVDLLPILSGETRSLSEKTREDLLKKTYSYYENDLAIVTWDRAFIYEPQSDSDVADIIEVANAQLLEFRYYDELLDDELPRMYELVKKARGASNIFAAKRFGDLARDLYTLVAEVTELTEKADNVLQVTEDVYLARVYLAALEIFRVPRVSAAVDRKLAIVRDTYAALYSEASGARGEALEIAVVFLIAIEIAIALIHHVS
jgi:hypothetical protein